jgi:hypothetical protein
MRCRALARALDVPPVVMLRGSAATTGAARALGLMVVDADSDALAMLGAELVVVDDPSPLHAARWIAVARQYGLPVAQVTDLGARDLGADVTIDGSLTRLPGSIPADLQGPEFAILDPAIVEVRERRSPRVPGRVLIALGGGTHVRTLGATLARRITAVVPQASVDIAAGFSRFRPVALPPRCRWIGAPHGLAEPLSTAAVAVVAGGVSLYEACTLGTPAIAIAVVPGQLSTVRAFARAGAVVSAAGPSRERTIDRASSGVAALLRSPRRRTALGRAGARLIDGHGASRVGAMLVSLAARGKGDTIRVA